MKKITLLLLTVLFALSHTAQETDSKPSDNRLVGSWRMEGADVDVKTDNKEATQQILDFMREDIKRDMEEMGMANLIFNADGSAQTYVDAELENEKMTYLLKGDSITFFFDGEETLKGSFKLKGNKLWLYLDVKDETLGSYPDLVAPDVSVSYMKGIIILRRE